MKASSLCLAIVYLVASAAFSRTMGDATNAPTAVNAADPRSQAYSLYQEATKLRETGDLDGALAKVNAALVLAPSEVELLVFCGDIYAKKRDWENASREFSAALAQRPDDALARFDLAEIKLMQKQYDAARPEFQLLVHSGQIGDLAAYKVFLCDLFAGHLEQAQAELKSFDQDKEKPSYTYGHAANWFYLAHADYAHHLLDEGAAKFSDREIQAYTSTLKELGYLPSPAK